MGNRRRTGRRSVIAALGALFLAVQAATQVAWPAQASESHEKVVAAAAGSHAGTVPSRQVAMPEVLSVSDAVLYERIFAVQEAGRWKEADVLIARVEDRLLMGHVLAQRYLHRNYLSSYKELKAWMAAYADHPQAERIHRLSGRKPRKGAGPVDPPVRGYLAGTGIDTGDMDANWELWTYDHLSGLKGARRAEVVKRKNLVRRKLRSGWTLAAKRFLQDADFLRGLPQVDQDELRLALANRYLADGRVEWAHEWAALAAERSGDLLPAAHWTAGIAAWRLGRPEEARRHFEAVGNAGRGSGWMIAAGAYWAARANLVTRRPEVVNHWLEVAAGHPRTFYGLLARRALGLRTRFAWHSEPLTETDVRMLSGAPAGRRALALLQVGDRDAAEQELRKLYPQANPPLVRAMLALAEAARMPELALKLVGLVRREDGRYHDSAAYPVPDWVPEGGWAVDKALVLAIARQESAFDPRARSHAGARGLMQLMPSTARFVAKGRPGNLSDPQYNLALGQEYIRHLLEHPTVGGNLFLLAASYNGGLGNVIRWQKELNHGDDPLLFIESIPSPETRIFVERVLTNLWIYRERLGQPAPALDEVISGSWPSYAPLDGEQIARNEPR